MGLEIEGAMQQAPQFGLHVMIVIKQLYAF